MFSAPFSASLPEELRSIVTPEKGMEEVAIRSPMTAGSAELQGTLLF